MDKVAIANVEKAAVVEQLQATTEWEKKLYKEISHAMAEL